MLGVSQANLTHSYLGYVGVARRLWDLPRPSLAFVGLHLLLVFVGQKLSNMSGGSNVALVTVRRRCDEVCWKPIPRGHWELNPEPGVKGGVGLAQLRKFS
jgi:hypothetical protein